MAVKSGQDELKNEQKQQGERDHDPRDEGELHGKHETFRGLEGRHHVEIAAKLALRVRLGLQQLLKLLFQIGRLIERGNEIFPALCRQTHSRP